MRLPTNNPIRFVRNESILHVRLSHSGFCFRRDA